MTEHPDATTLATVLTEFEAKLAAMGNLADTTPVEPAVLDEWARARTERAVDRMQKIHHELTDEQRALVGRCLLEGSWQEGFALGYLARQHFAPVTIALDPSIPDGAHRGPS